MVTPAPEPRRVGALDGLRGWAALFVVFNHVLSASLTWYTPPGVVKWPVGSGRWWLVQSPLHLFWAGPEMVFIFFVLSGYVLTLPVLRRGMAWFGIGYFPRRLVRLYLPAWAAIAFAAVLHFLPTRSVQPGAAVFLDAFAIPLRLSDVAKTVTLLGPVSDLNGLTSVLWSMRWEVIFSMLLPLAVLGGLFTRRRPWLAVLAAGACFALICTAPDDGGFIDKAIRYLPVFLLGVLMAVHCPPRVGRTAASVPAAGRSPQARPWPAGAGSRGASLVAVAVCIGLLTIGYWTVNEDLGSTSGWVEAGTVAGACLAVWLCLGDRLMAGVMDSRISQWLGRRSYSLYLIHQPIIISLAFAFHGHVNPIVLTAIGLPLVLIATELMWRLVEQPTIGLSRWIGLRLSARRATVS